MDLKQQIDQLNEVIINYTENIEMLKDKKKIAEKRRKELIRLRDKANNVMGINTDGQLPK